MKKIIAALLLLVTAGAEWCHASDEFIQVDWAPLGHRDKGWSIVSNNIAFGWNAVVSGDPYMDSDIGNSFEISWLNVVAAEYNTGRGQRITAGVGINWRNYKMDKGTMRFVHDDENGITSIVPYPDMRLNGESRLKVFSLQVPVLFRQSVYKHTAVYVGPIANFNVRGSIKSKYTNAAGEKITDYTHSNMHLKPVTVDVIGGLEIYKLGVYVRYSPCHLFKDGYGPQFSSLSMGFMLTL